MTHDPRNRRLEYLNNVNDDEFFNIVDASIDYLNYPSAVKEAFRRHYPSATDFTTAIDNGASIYPLDIGIKQKGNKLRLVKKIAENIDAAIASNADTKSEVEVVVIKEAEQTSSSAGNVVLPRQALAKIDEIDNDQKMECAQGGDGKSNEEEVGNLEKQVEELRNSVNEKNGSSATLSQESTDAQQDIEKDKNSETALSLEVTDLDVLTAKGRLLNTKEKEHQQITSKDILAVKETEKHLDEPEEENKHKEDSKNTYNSFNSFSLSQSKERGAKVQTQSVEIERLTKQNAAEQLANAYPYQSTTAGTAVNERTATNTELEPLNRAGSVAVRQSSSVCPQCKRDGDKIPHSGMTDFAGGEMNPEDPGSYSNINTLYSMAQWGVNTLCKKECSVTSIGIVTTCAGSFLAVRIVFLLYKLCKGHYTLGQVIGSFLFSLLTILVISADTFHCSMDDQQQQQYDTALFILGAIAMIISFTMLIRGQ